MLNATDKINGLLQFFSDHGNAAASKFLTYFGVSGSAAGVTTMLSKNAINGHYVEPHFLWFTLTEWGSIVGVAGGISLVLKFFVDWHYRRKQDRREEEAHRSLMGLNND